MIRAPSSSGRRPRLIPRAFATFSLAAAVAILVGLLTTGASIAATSQDKPTNTKPPAIAGSAVEKRPPARGPRYLDGRSADHVQVPLAPLQPGSRKLHPDPERDG